ncbi:hypothetical protein FQA39_LY05150 [Lamprigera yunnana]|nr:hypothetical protein FQA39_LY05150 [Lamprigera yunnana]
MMQTARTSKSESGNSTQHFTRQGSLRRVVTSEHNRDNIFGRQNEDINMLYKAIHREYIILAEYEMIISEKVTGIYVIPSRENPLVWFGVIFVRSGLYEDGIFRFNINLPEEFPDGEHPKVIFQSEVFHPVINVHNNELNLLNAFPMWVKGEQHIWQIIKYIFWIFYNFDASISHSVHKEAADLYKENIDTFKEKVKQCVKKSKAQLYDLPPTDDKHYITFEEYNPEVHDAVKSSMIKEMKVNQREAIGHSWVSLGSFKPLSRPPSPHNISN